MNGAANRHRLALAGLIAASVAYLAAYNWQVLIADLYADLAMGSRFISTGSVGRGEFISWWAQAHGAVSLPHQWLYQVLAAAVYDRAGLGYGGMVALFAGVAAAFLVAYARLLDPGRLRSAGTLTLFAAAAFPLAFVFPVDLLVRPQSLALLLLALLWLVLATPRHRRWRLPAAFLLSLLAANVHGGFWPVLALLLVAAAWKYRDPWTLACLASVLLTPSGLPLLALPLSFAGVTRFSQAYILEWKPVYATGTLLLPFCWLLLAGGSLLLLLSRRQRDPGSVRLPELAAFALLALTPLASVRYLVPFLVVGLPYYGEQLAAEADALVRRLPKEASRAAYPLALAPAAIALAWLLLLSPYRPTLPPPRRQVPAPAVVSALRSGRFLNAESGSGGFLYWELGLRPMMDGRWGVYAGTGNPSLLEQYMAALDSKAGLVRLLDTTGVRLVLVPLQADRSWLNLYARYGLAGDPRFRVVASDDRNLVIAYRKGAQ